MRLKLWLFIALASLVFPAWAEKTILLIESYHEEYPWDASYIKGIESVLGSRYTIERFQMDTKRIPKSQYEQSAENAWKKYQAVKPDLVMLGDDNALKYLGKRIDAEGTPVVFLGINSNPRKAGVMEMRNVAGVLERPLFKRSIKEMEGMFPEGLRRVLILFDNGTTSQAAVEEAFSGKSSTTMSGIQVDLKMIGQLDEWKKTVLAAKKEGYDAMIIGLYHTITDQTGQHVDAEEVIRWTSANTPIPPFAFWDFAVGADKAAGGLVLFGETQGVAAAELADRILQGTPASKLSPNIITGDKGRFLFSRTQLKKWGLALPEPIRQRAAWVD